MTTIERNKILNYSCNSCFYCGNLLSEEKMHVDHMVPKSKGGSNRRKNLIASCGPCNIFKSNSTVNEFLSRVKDKHSILTKRINYLEKIIENIESIA